MEEDQNGSEKSHGSEARPNTPFIDPISELPQDGTGYPTTTRDPTLTSRIPKDNTSAGNPFQPLKSTLSKKYTLTKHALPMLSPLTEKTCKNGEIASENEIQSSGSRGGRTDWKLNNLKQLKSSSAKHEVSDQNSPTIANCNNNAMALPKIDTYCISHVRPSTNHGFSYAVSSNDLLNGKKHPPRAVKRKKLNVASEVDGFPYEGNVYLLFKASSRACGLNIPGFTGRTRPKERIPFKGAKQLNRVKKPAVQTNIVRLPDINDNIWK